MPLLQGYIGFFNEPALRGQTSKGETEGGSCFFDGSKQSSLAENFTKKLGFRKLSIKLNNTLNALLFREYESSDGTGVIIGKNKELFEMGPLMAYRQSALVPNDTLREKVKNIITVSDWLQANGVRLILLISPSKVSAYRGKVPSEWELHEGYESNSSYLRMKQMLENSSVKILDGPEFIKDVSTRRQIPMFPKTGTHWNYVAACEVASNLTLLIDSIIPETTGKLLCGDTVAQAKPKGDDDDLLDIMNVYYKEKFFPENFYYPKTSHDKNNVTRKPNILVIGSSYVWQLVKVLDKHNLFSKFDFYYYFTRHFHAGVKEIGYVKRDPDSLKADLLSRDIIVVETNEVVIAQAGFEFFEHAYELAK